MESVIPQSSPSKLAEVVSPSTQTCAVNHCSNPQPFRGVGGVTTVAIFGSHLCFALHCLQSLGFSSSGIECCSAQVLGHWIFLKIYLLTLYIWLYCSCLQTHQKRASDPTTGGCEPPCGCWELNSGPLEEQSVLLTTEPSLQPQSKPLDLPNHFITLKLCIFWMINIWFASIACFVGSLVAVFWEVSCSSGWPWPCWAWL